MRAKKPPTAIIFNNDAMALGGCRALVEMGVEPGKNMAVVVIVDTALCRYYSPPLTVSALPWSRSAGEWANAACLHARIRWPRGHQNHPRSLAAGARCSR